MRKLLFLVVTVGCASAQGQTPASNPMPDGSRDMYAGLGVQSAPRYDGTGSRKLSAVPVIQVEWSNGVFVSGMSAGIHLSDRPTLEYGPLLSVLPGRSASGTAGGADGVGVVAFAPPSGMMSLRTQPRRLDGMDDIGTRVLGGGFFNAYLDPDWRLTSSLLYGSGQARNGARMTLDVQRLAATLGGRHQLSFTAGLTAVNRNDNASYFGVTELEAARSRFDAYAPTGGLRDAHAGARWNWILTPAWMLSSTLQAQRLLGSASHSPLAERSSNLTVSTAIAYRF